MASEWPVLWPWVLHEVRPGIGVRMERNPYYWWVDKEGRQLPYIDEVRSVVARSSEVLALKLLAGEVDEAHRNTNIEMVPVMLDEGSKRGLEVKLYPTEYGSPWAVGFNYMNSDPTKRELFRTAEFRQALSLAINRRLINRVGLLGLGKPTQGYLIPNSPWYTEEVNTAFVAHEPERANQMLDALGLGQRDAEGFRLDPGGQPLSIVYYVAVRGELDVPIGQYVVDGWRSVGVRTLLRTIPQEQLTNAIRTANFDTVQTSLRGSMYPIELFRRGGGGIIPGGGWGLQMVFQDPYSSLNPRMTVKEVVGEPLRVQGLARRGSLDDRVSRMLHLVGLSTEHLERFPHAFSGGQRQRIAIARAMVLEAQFLVADEPVSALDVSVQAQILNLLLDLQTRFSLTLLFIAHDIDLIRHLSDRIAVMYLGQVVEVGAAEEVCSRPSHPYAETLLSSVPLAVPGRDRQRPSSVEELPDPADPPAGCYFHPRCSYAQEVCRREAPALAAAAAGSSHVARCHFSDELHLDGLSAEAEVARAVERSRRDLEARLAGSDREAP